jgi:glycosyltransferase involved in cell wall biosynthesis
MHPGPKPVVSVVLPARNAALTLPAALESVRCQSFPHWELLLIDDGSTDSTPAVVRQFAQMDPRIHLCTLPPLGLAHALNHGLSRARGEFIARMDADDLSHPERLEAQLDRINRERHLGVVGCRVRYGGDPRANAGYALHVHWTNSLLTPDAIRLNRFIDSPLPHPSVLFRRGLIDQHGGYRMGPFPEDYELWLRWLDAGVVMGKVDRELLTWNDPPGRLSRCDPRYSPAAFYQLKADYLARVVSPQLQGRALWVWGAGRLSRRRAELLESHNLRIEGFIDIDPRKTRQRTGARPVLLTADMPGPREAIVLVFVANRGARDLIRSALLTRGYRDGLDTWFAA